MTADGFLIYHPTDCWLLWGNQCHESEISQGQVLIFLFLFLFFLLFFFFNYLPITLIVLHLLLNISNSARSLGCNMNNYIKSLSRNLFFPLFFCLYRKFLATTLQTTVPDGWHVSSSSHCPKWIWKVNPPPSCAAVIVFLPAEPQAWLGCKSEFLTSF